MGEVQLSTDSLDNGLFSTPVNQCLANGGYVKEDGLTVDMSYVFGDGSSGTYVLAMAAVDPKKLKAAMDDYYQARGIEDGFPHEFWPIGEHPNYFIDRWGPLNKGMLPASRLSDAGEIEPHEAMVFLYGSTYGRVSGGGPVEQGMIYFSIKSTDHCVDDEECHPRHEIFMPFYMVSAQWYSDDMLEMFGLETTVDTMGHDFDPEVNFDCSAEDASYDCIQDEKKIITARFGDQAWFQFKHSRTLLREQVEPYFEGETFNRTHGTEFPGEDGSTMPLTSSSLTSERMTNYVFGGSLRGKDVFVVNSGSGPWADFLEAIEFNPFAAVYMERTQEPWTMAPQNTCEQ